MTIRDVRKLIKTLAYDLARKVARSFIEKEYPKSERSQIGEPSFIALLKYFTFDVICDASRGVEQIKSCKNIASLSPMFQHVRKEMWKNYYSMVEETSTLALPSNSRDVLLCAYLIALCQYEHITEFSSPKVYTVRKNVRRNSVLFARRHSPGNSVDMVKQMNDRTDYDGFSKRDPDITHY